MRILIIEDDEKTSDYLSRGLTENTFLVDTANTAADGLRMATTASYDLVLLDVMLPDKDGWSVLEELRKAGKEMPVLFLTARDAVEDRVKGLNLGADDYLIKPFAFTELLARVRSLLRRRPPLPLADKLSVGDLEVDVTRRRVTRAGKYIELTVKEFDLLLFLLRNAGNFQSRTVIMEQVWDVNFDTDSNIVDVQVRRLRAKVDDPFKTKLVHTVRGVGYVIEERN